MPHLHRFYVPTEASWEETVTLPPDEAHHALHVARLRPGARVALFDGRGKEGLGNIVQTGRKTMDVSLETTREEPRPARGLTLAQAWLNHEKHLETIIARGTELGVERFIFFRAERSERAPVVRERWERLAIESCKQCGRLWLPEFVLAGDLREVLSVSEDVRLIAVKGGNSRPLGPSLDGEGDVLLIVGPEGDFSEAEIESALGAGTVPVDLGDHTLRSEVAAIVAVALIQYELGRLGPRT